MNNNILPNQPVILVKRELLRLYPKDSRTRNHGGGRSAIRISLHRDVLNALLSTLSTGGANFKYRSAFVALAIELLCSVLTGRNTFMVADKLRRIYGADALWLSTQLEAIAREVEEQTYQARQKQS